MTPGGALIGVLGIGSVLNLLRIAASKNSKDALLRSSRVLQAESERNERLAREHERRKDVQRGLAQAQLQIALQQRGLVHQGGPMAPYITAARQGAER